jgi:hypothetical protein
MNLWKNIRNESTEQGDISFTVPFCYSKNQSNFTCPCGMKKVEKRRERSKDRMA